jgi:hypothetical protein
MLEDQESQKPSEEGRVTENKSQDAEIKPPAPVSEPADADSQRSVAQATEVIKAAISQRASDAANEKEPKTTKPAAKCKSAAAKPAPKAKVTKRPAAKEVPKSAMKKAVVKKASKAEPRGKKVPMKVVGEKVASAKAKDQKALPIYSKKAALQLRPIGCSKCRNTPGCTPSCVKRFFKFT